MTKTLPILAGLLVGLLVACPANAQLKRDRSKECVICHVTWGDGFEAMATTLRPVEQDVLIDGMRSRVGSNDMCWSCHDGYVVDSRQRFIGDDPHMRPTERGAVLAASGLRLAESGEVYCGTCHTPHTTVMERSYSFSPFLRQETAASQICVSCHADHAEPLKSHPIHVRMDGAFPASLGSKRTAAGTVECLTCHDMHSKRTAKLLEGHDRTRLCRSCHEPQFELLLSDHELNVGSPETLVGATGRRAGEMDACGSCHLTHGAQGAALWSWPLPAGRSQRPVSDGVDARCLSCHRDGGAAADKPWLGHGHPVGRAPEAVAAGLPVAEDGTMSCLTCHDPHRWTVVDGRDPGTGDDEGDALTSFLRLPDDENSRLCSGCHRDESQVLVSDHNSFSWSEPSPGQCTSCHETHGRTPFVDDHDRPEFSAFTSLCLHCHEGAGIHGATGLGEHGHPLGDPLPAGAGLPSMGAGHFTALQVERDPTAPGRVGCESCHDPHRWSPLGAGWAGAGSDGDESSSFLRVDNTSAALCGACHQAERTVLGSQHDLGPERPGHSACSACHTTHGAGSDWAIVATSLDGAAMAELAAAAGELEQDPANWSPGARHCLSCHRADGESSVVPLAWGHPRAVETLAGAWRADGRETPLFAVEGRSLEPLGRVDCTSCHNPHVAHPTGATEHATDFLRDSSRGKVCADCHGESALWKYRYYHNPEKRELP